MNILEKSIRAIGGVFNERLLAYFKNYGATSNVLQDAEKEYLKGKGLTFGANQDAWKQLDGKYEDIIPLEVSDILNKYDATMLLPGVSGVLRFGYQPGNYRESTGQTLAAADQQVGLVVDAGKAGVRGPDLLADWDFLSAAAWQANGGVALAVSGGIGTASFPAGSNYPTVLQYGATEVGKLYEVEIRAKKNTADTVRFLAGAVSTNITDTFQTYRLVYQAVATSTLFRVQVVAPSAVVGSFEIDYFRVRELPGIHASQSTSGFQPVLRRGLLNQLLWSSDFSNAAWVTTNASKSITGGVLKLIEDSTNAQHDIKQYFSTGQKAQSSTYAVVAQAAERTRIALTINAYGGNGVRAYFDLSSGGVLLEQTLGNGIGATATISDLGGGKYLCALSGTPSATVGNGFDVNTIVVASDINASHPGDGTSGIYLNSAALFQGIVTAEEIIAAGGIPVTTSAPASSANGIQSWQFDGTDDRLSLSAVPFQMADDHFVVVGARVGAVGSRRTMFYNGGAVNNPMCPRLSIEPSGSVMAAWRGDGGTTATAPSSSTLIAGSDFVATARRSGSVGNLRLNGIHDSLSAVDPGVTTLTQAFVGCGAGGSSFYDFHNGHLHGVIFGKGAISDSELLTLERFMASLQGRTL